MIFHSIPTSEINPHVQMCFFGTDGVVRCLCPCNPDIYTDEEGNVQVEHFILTSKNHIYPRI